MTGSTVILFCLQGQELGKGGGYLAAGDSEAREAERVGCGEPRPTAGLRLGRFSVESWMWQAQQTHLVVVERALFQKPMFVAPQRCPDRNRLCCSHISGAPKICLLLC